jgi:exodeoxyribonuclease V gamma subunit
MVSSPYCIFSNHVEMLYERLRDQLFDQDKPFFLTRVVVVPSLAMKRWLSLRLARDPLASACFNIKFLYLSSSRPFKLPTKFEMALKIEVEILKVKDQELMPDLFEYLNLDRSSSRLSSLCHDTAALFLEYIESSSSMIDEWIKNPSSWQAQLFVKIFDGINPYKSFIESAAFSQVNKEVHLFALSFIPKIYLRYFSKVNHPVFIYALSPTLYFWTDIKSKIESKRLLDFLKEKNTPLKERRELVGYLMDVNSLLADFGKVGRVFFSMLEELDFEVEEAYECSQEMSFYYQNILTDHLSFKNQQGSSLLKALQMDLLLMRGPHDKIEIPLLKPDDSIQIHFAPTLLREVEVLYSNLLQYVHQTAVLEEEIVVMAPNIKEYAPYIEAVFGATDSKFDYQLLDLKISSQNLINKGFETFLNLIGSRFEWTDLKKLLGNKAFYVRHGLTLEDFEVFKKWVDDSVTWGFDKAHRQNTLKKIYSSDKFQLDEEKTIQETLKNIINSFCLIDESRKTLELSLSEVFGKWSELIYDIIDDIRFLESGTKKKVNLWAEYLHNLLDKYFDGEKEELFSFFDTFKKFDIEQEFSFDTILHHIKDKLNQDGATAFDNKISAIRFCSLLPMRAIPAKCVCLLGLSNLSFPRISKKHPLDERLKYNNNDYLPTSAEFDRYLFLETLLSCREKLILSYSNKNGEDSCRLSDIVKEMIQYIKRYFDINIEIESHPLDPFDEYYFKEGNLQFKYFPHASSLYLNAKERKKAPIDNFVIRDVKINHEKLIDIKTLVDLIKTPFKFYINHVLNLQLNDERKEEDKEKFFLSGLDEYKLKKAALSHSYEEIVGACLKKKLLPEGLFKKFALEKIYEVVANVKQNLESFGLDSKDIKNYHFEQNCRSSVHFDKLSVVPSINVEVDNEIYTLYGKIENVCPTGIISLKKDTFYDLIKEMPLFLTLSMFHEEKKGIEIFQVVEAKKKSFSFKKELMVKLINYYKLCKSNPSPLNVHSIESFISGESKIQPYDYEPHINLVDLNYSNLDPKWIDISKDIFEDIFKEWNAK